MDASQANFVRALRGERAAVDAVAAGDGHRRFYAAVSWLCGLGWTLMGGVLRDLWAGRRGSIVGLLPKDADCFFGGADAGGGGEPLGPALLLEKADISSEAAECRLSGFNKLASKKVHLNPIVCCVVSKESSMSTTDTELIVPRSTVN